MLADEMKINLEETAKNIKRYMLLRGLTKAKLVQLTGLSRNCISNYLNGYNAPGLVNLGVLAEALNTDISKLIVY